MEFFKSLIFFFINNILNKVPIRSFRQFFYSRLSGRKISFRSSIGLGVKFLDIRNVTIGENTNVNNGSIIDGRGAQVIIGSNVDIAPQVNIWTLEHDPRSPIHESRAGQVVLEDHAWIANRAIVLPNTTIGKGTTVGAGAVVKGVILENSIYAGNPARKIGERGQKPEFKLRKLRMFR